MAGKLLLIAFRNLRRQLRRTILTALTCAVAVFIYTVLVAVPWSMDRIADNASKGLRLVVTELNNGRLPARYCDQINKLPHVIGCAPEIIWTAVYRDPKNPIVTYGVTPDIVKVTSGADYGCRQNWRGNSDRPTLCTGGGGIDASVRLEVGRTVVAQPERSTPVAHFHSLG